MKAVSTRKINKITIEAPIGTTKEKLRHKAAKYFPKGMRYKIS